MAIRRDRVKSTSSLNSTSDASGISGAAPSEAGSGANRVGAPSGARHRQESRSKLRKHLIESLEARHLMALGPQLIGIQPNNSDLLNNGDVREVAPRELVFRFDDAQVIDAATLSGIRITRAGGDGSFGVASVSTDFGSLGKVSVELASRSTGSTFDIKVQLSDLGVNKAPVFAVAGTVITMTLNSNASTPTKADQLVAAINSTPIVANLISAKINGGFGSTVIGTNNPSLYSPIKILTTNDQPVLPGAVLVGNSPNENEVTFRFADNLGDDLYRIEVFGFDDSSRGITGLRAVGVAGKPGDIFVPSKANTRQDTIDFRIDLGPQVTAVVPQPVYQNNGVLIQQRDTIVVHFDNDKLLVENGNDGKPTQRSAENPAFYQLIFTNDTVRNTDDNLDGDDAAGQIAFLPQTAKYDALANTVTLKFARDLELLPNANTGPRTYRLRIGTRETAPLVPTRSEAAATAISDLNTDGAAKIRFTSKTLGEDGGGIQVDFVNSLLGGAPVITPTGPKSIRVDLRSSNLTASQLLNALRVNSASQGLFNVSLEPGSDPNAIVSGRPINYSPITLLGLGSSFDTATNLGTLGSSVQTQTSLILSSTIDPKPFSLDLLGANNDPGHRQLGEEVGNSFEQHVSDLFGADTKPGVTTILYNFKLIYGTDSSGTDLFNAITDKQKDRAREVLGLWANYLGVQFVETADQGVTIATGDLSALKAVSGTRLRTEPANNFGVRIDPTYTNSLLIMQASRNWNDNYGEDYFRTSAAGVGFLLGLEHNGETTDSTLMKLNPLFLGANADVANDFEPIVPANQDILHGQYIDRPDSNDIDLYRFDVDFGNDDRVGMFVAETFAERQTTASQLDTNLQLYRNTFASATSNFGAGQGLAIHFESALPGKQGNQLQIFVTRSDRGGAGAPIISVFKNLITVDLNNSVGFETTAQQLVDAMNANPSVRKYVSASITNGAGSTKIGNLDITYSPIVLTGGELELIAQNDDYFSEDSLISQKLRSGIYYIGVSASGNEKYDATIADTGFGGRTQGKYDLRISFRAQVDTTDAIQDIEGTTNTNGVTIKDRSVTIDGDADGSAGGTYDFWFQTRPLDRTLEFTAGGADELEGKVVTLTGGTGQVRRFEFSKDTAIGLGNVRVPYTNASTANQLAVAFAAAVNGQANLLKISASANGNNLILSGERKVELSANLPSLVVHGRTIFVDKSAGPNADGSLAHPFNNISSTLVPSAFSVAQPGDIVRIVGNGGADGKIETVADNFAYEIGFGLLPNTVLSDGTAMEVPKGVTAMVDAGAVFKLRRSYIGTGSTSLSVDRNGGALQVLGTPNLTNKDGRLYRNADGSTVPGSVFFTSWLDESIGLDNYSPSTTPSSGDWGGISFRRDLDRASGRFDLEDEGIFLRYVNHADIRYGGGSNVVINSIQTLVNPIEMIDVRPTITFNKISKSSDAAMSAAPNSFEETNFQEPRFQTNGEFTSDYDRVGPEIHHNSLVNNSLNGLFVKILTPSAGATRTLTVPGRFNDIDIPHIITENLLIAGTPGASLLDTTIPPSDSIAMAQTVGGTLQAGIYNYKITFVDRFGYETPSSEKSADIQLDIGKTAIALDGLPAISGEYVNRRVYRSDSQGGGTYRLVAQLNIGDSSFIDFGQELGGTLVRDRADVSTLNFAPDNNGTLPAGTYNYRVVMIDAVGRESVASSPSANQVTLATGAIEISNLPLTQEGYSGRRIYRSASNGQGPYTLIAELHEPDSTSITNVVDNGSDLGLTLSALSLGTVRPRLDASLVVDPGTVVKLEGSRIEIGFGAQLLAEGTDGLPVVFTSKLDDRYGAGGSFDTNNDSSGTKPSPRDWGGIYASGTSNLSIDHGVVGYAGGVTKIEGTFRAFNTIELQQAQARIANTTFENNENGVGGQGPATRLGRLTNAPATIFVRGAQPILIGNTFLNNRGSAIDIDANSMTEDLLGDRGRMTGAADRNETLDSNHGPLIRFNRMSNNELNGMEIRGETLTTESIWDDTDVVHVLFDSVITGNLNHDGGLRLQSAPNESLVVKFSGAGSNFNYSAGAGISAVGSLSDISDRVGGTVQVIGYPGSPVVLTSLRDDSVGAGLQPNGLPETDTNNDGINTIPQPGDWRSVLLDQFTNDRNVATILETESPNAVAPGSNGSAATAQFLGNLAGSPSASDENLVLGFVIHGVLGQEEDQDVYSFSGEAGSEVWLDIDHTTQSSDMVVEFLDANGNLLARSDNSYDETIDPSQLVKTGAIDKNLVNTLPSRTAGDIRRNASGLIKDDGSINPRDAGMRIVLPGSVGTRSTYHFRVRSASLNMDDSGAGLTRGSYDVQVRMREAQEFAGSTVQYADIRYSTNGVDMHGLPYHSPLLGEVQEDESVRPNSIAKNDDPAGGLGITDVKLARPQYVGNLLQSDRGAISIGGKLSSLGDVDFYRFDIAQGQLVDGTGAPQVASVVFDMDYADGLNRPDTSLAVYRVTGTGVGESYQLIYVGEDSNIADDRRKPLALSDLSDLSRGSVGPNDPYIGSAALTAGTYMVAVTSSNRVPSALSNPAVRRYPINSVIRIADDSIDTSGGNTAAPPVLPQLLDRSFVGTSVSPKNLWHVSNSQAGAAGHNGPQTFQFGSFAGGQIDQIGGAQGDMVSNAFNLGGYSAEDLPNLYMSYLLESDGDDRFDVLVRTAAGTDTLIGSSVSPGVTRLQNSGWTQAKLDLGAFAGQNNLRLVFRYNTIGSNPQNTGVHIDDLVIGFAERGEAIQGAGSGATFTARAGANVAGEYQLEIRKGEDFFTSTTTGLRLEKSWDTNDRQAEQLTLIAPEGRSLEDGDVFELSDGSTRLKFEFTLDSVVALGNNAIKFSKSDSDITIGQKIRDAINAPSIQSRLKIQAATTGGVVTGTVGGDNRVNLFGRVAADFKEYKKPALSIQQVTTNGNQLRDTILGTGLSVTGDAIYTGGAQSAAIAKWGDDTGILLSTGNVNTAVGPNTSDRSSGISSNLGDAKADAALGVTTTDSTSLEVAFQFGDGTTGGDLFLDVVFASEEYNELAARDILAVLVDDVNIALVPGTGNPINSASIRGNNPLYVNNDPNDAGKFLNEVGFDGFTLPISLSATGLTPGEHKLRIVIADTVDKLVDSAVFIKAQTVATKPSVRTFGGLSAIYHSGNADLNINRDQGEVIIANNFIRNARDYGISSKPGSRLLDPRDVVAAPLSVMFQNRPNTVGTTGLAVRNLRELNNDLIGGFSPGVVIVNNVLQEGGLGGIYTSGENPIWMISPAFVPTFDDTPLVPSPTGTHFGSYVNDGDVIVIDADRERARLEFEDVAGAPVGGPDFGSGFLEGNGWQDTNIPVYYREDTGAAGIRQAPIGFSNYEVLAGLRDSILGSILVTNGTTSHINAIIAPSYLDPDLSLGAALTPSTGFIRYFNRTSVYLEGANNLYFEPAVGSNPFDIRRVDIAEAPQPFARILNNTVIGKDGRASFQGETNAAEPNDTLATAVETWQGTAHNPTSFTATASIGDSSQFRANPAEDVDIYQFKLNTGDRARINIDALPGSSLDSIMQIFDSRGRVQFFRNSVGRLVSVSDDDAAPGENQASDPYIDFTATYPDVFYAAVSAKLNDSFDPLSLANRKVGSSKGAYRISLEVLHPQDFTMTVNSNVQPGDTFTISQIPNLPGQATTDRTFEIVNAATGVISNPANIPIPIDFTLVGGVMNYRVPDIARAIASAITGSGVPPLPNTQNLDNGAFGLANPIDPVSAIALGGISGVQPGLRLFPRRPDGAFPTYASLGIGFDRTLSGAVAAAGGGGAGGGAGGGGAGGTGGVISTGDGTTEKYVVIKNASKIVSRSGALRVDADVVDNHNLDQLLPETGVLVSNGASPTIMNNVFMNVQTPVVDSETRGRFSNPNPLTDFKHTGQALPFGSANPNNDPKPGEVILGGSIYQYIEPGVADNRLGQGIEATPTNVPNTSLDFNVLLPNNSQLFVNAQAASFFPAPRSAAIDSAIDSIQERESFRTIREAMGISKSPILAPSRDAEGQLRADDPDVATPQGLGSDVFKDRGALDRADFVGPSANTLVPVDNDSARNDRDGAVSFIQLTSGTYPEFRIQLQDGLESADPFPGIGIDDSSVNGPIIPDLRLQGAAVTVFEDGKMLQEGFDYTFAYNTTTNEIVLTPLAGVWKNDRVYEIALNNKDRFVLKAPSGDQIEDGDTFTATDNTNGIVYFEYDSGYRLQIPQGIQINVPLAGANAGGIVDGDRFSIDDGRGPVTFELDRNGNVLPGSVPVPFSTTSTQSDIANAIAQAITNNGVLVTPNVLPNGRVFLGSAPNTRLQTSFSRLDQPKPTLGLRVPTLGARPGGVNDGQTFTVNDGLKTIVFEFDNDGVGSGGNTLVDISTANTPNDVAKSMETALIQSGLKLTPQIIGGDVVFLGLTTKGNVDSLSSRLSVVGVSRTITDGQSFDISFNGNKKTFEFSTDGVVAPGSIKIDFNPNETQDVIGKRVADIITNAGLDLDPIHLSDGNISIGGTEQHVVSVKNASSLGLFGIPGVAPNTTLEIQGSLVLKSPARGGGDILDNSFFSITNNNKTVTFEFDSNFSGPSIPGNVVITYVPSSSPNDIAVLMASAISSAGLGITAANIGGGKVDIGLLASDQVNVTTSQLTAERGNVTDGEKFTITDGVKTVTFEFDNVSKANGFTASNVPVLFSNSSSRDEVALAMKAAIEGSILGLQVQVLPNATVRLLDTPRHITTTTLAPSLKQTGVPGGAKAIHFAQDVSFTGEDVVDSIVKAVNLITDSPIRGKKRGGDTLFLENIVSVSPNFVNYHIRAIEDVAGNNLKPNRINNETQFTILMPGVTLDYGDAPDPFNTTLGRYATLHENNGARHVVSSDGLFLGKTITSESNGKPTPSADGDAGDDGVVFVSARNPNGLFNKFIATDLTVTVSGAGFVDGWVDFNADGDFDDPGEKVLDSVEFKASKLTQTFSVSLPTTAPEPIAITKSFARFRVSSAGGLLPDGLSVDGEVEDYAVTLVPGTPPTAVNDVYTLNEDGALDQITDPTGTASPNFTNDDGVAANDVDPEGGPFTVTLVDPPLHASVFSINADGTFTYKPQADYFGTDSFTYRVSDGVLTSNNIGTVSLVVREVNDAPIATNDLVTLNEDETLLADQSFLLNNDVAGPANESTQTLTISRVQTVSARGGSVTLLSNGKVRYIPPTDFSGTDSFTYTIVDNGTTLGVSNPLEATATVSLTILEVNDPPLPGIDSLTVLEDTSISRATSFFLANDTAGPSNESGQAIRFVSVDSASSQGGLVVLNGTTVTYTPAADFVGTDTFFYTIEDNGAPPQRAKGTVTVTVTGVNDAPRVQSPMGTKTLREDDADFVIDLANVFKDPDVVTSGDVLSYRLVSNSNTGLVDTIFSGSRMTLRLKPDQNGQAKITVEAKDLSGAIATDVLTLNVTPVEDAPRLIAGIPDVNVDEDAQSVSIVLTPDHFFDPDVLTNNDSLTLSIVSNSNTDLVTSVLNGKNIVLSFAPNQSGRATITVRAKDNANNTISDTFDVVVSAVNDAPITKPDTYTVQQDGQLRTTDAKGTATATANDNGVLANDSDIEGDSFTAQLKTPPANGTVVLNPDGTFTYTPRGLSGSQDTFTYVAIDSGNAVSAETTVTILVGNPAPPRHQNPLQPLDVNADGFISPIDALLVINFLNLNGPSTSVANLPDPPPYRDANGDNRISVSDALAVINFLNQRGNGEGEGEGSTPKLDNFGALAGLSWQMNVARPVEGLAVSLSEKAPVKSNGVYGPVQSVESSMNIVTKRNVSLDEYLMEDWIDDAAISLASAEGGGDASQLADLALASLMGLSDEEQS